MNVSKRKKAISNLDRNEGLSRCKAINQDFSSKIVQSLPSDLSNIKIDAYTYGEIRYIQSNHSDQESQLNEFSMLKFDSVAKFDYIMLASDSLLVYDSQHEKYRLITNLSDLNVDVVKLPMDGDLKSTKYSIPFALESYQILITVDATLQVELRVWNCLNYTTVTSLSDSFADNVKYMLQDHTQPILVNYMMGNYFLKKIKDVCPSLNVIPTCFD